MRGDLCSAPSINQRYGTLHIAMAWLLRNDLKSLFRSIGVFVEVNYGSRSRKRTGSSE